MRRRVFPRLATRRCAPEGCDDCRFRWTPTGSSVPSRARSKPTIRRRRAPSTRTATSSVPATVFPYAPERKYTPCDAAKEKLFELRDFLGFDKNVIVQATCHGADNSALADALRASDGRARGVATVQPDVSGDELADLHAAGVRGVRFNFVKRLVDPKPRRLLPRHRRPDRADSAGTSSCTSRPRNWPSAGTCSPSRCPRTVVVDHMGRPDVAQPRGRPRLRAVHALHARARELLVQGERGRNG